MRKKAMIQNNEEAEDILKTQETESIQEHIRKKKEETIKNNRERKHQKEENKKNKQEERRTKK